MIWTKRWRVSRRTRRIARVATLLRRQCVGIRDAQVDRTDEELAQGAAQMENELRRETSTPLQVRRVRTISATATGPSQAERGRKVRRRRVAP
jgi:hypothetical protein